MTDETRKEQEKKDELTEKDLDKASGGAPHQYKNEQERPKPQADRK
jgi:hypothetical protein